MFIHILFIPIFHAIQFIIVQVPNRKFKYADYSIESNYILIYFTPIKPFIIYSSTRNLVTVIEL